MCTEVSRGKVLGRRPVGLIMMAGIILWSAAGLSAENQKPPLSHQFSASEEGLYLVIDMARGNISLRLAEVELRQHTFTLISDSLEAQESVREWLHKSRKEQTVESVHLLSAAPIISEPELKIINEETNLSEDQIQRYLPGRMVLLTGGDLRIYIETDCPNPEAYTWERVKEFFRSVWYGVTGGDAIHIRMSANDAMSLYGAARTRPAITVKP